MRFTTTCKIKCKIWLKQFSENVYGNTLKALF